ncbi:uncharacterized protein LAESUDRAFT_810529 [Laetiporus sulphureus 93-53]|uniref:Uncharacterized protein n=1 Tax=Laetiporus sulphureus 93-53 TaxID=1314785 RepID=A0A165FWX8_9APHY|nr:uncharacterized protein LAESUDRAFT_810529 [Laetiporus sulphureus 93-53]KZT09521.1 hypothetical protein LAESUDRAFT_810529 [Laetiporus sulphureus 93-53]
MEHNRKAERKPISREVTNLLHTLRGEHYRHEQNLQRSKARVPSYRFRQNPTLPFDQIYADRQPEQRRPILYPDVPTPVKLGPEGVLEYAYPRGPVPGPTPPPSWSRLFGKGKGKEVEESEHRAEALSLIFSHLPTTAGAPRSADAASSSIPPLTLICLQYLLSLFSDSERADDFAEIVPYIPPHLRRDLMRWSAQHSPLPSSKLFALCDAEGHADGELIVVGPQASLPRNYFRRIKAADMSTEHVDAVHGDQEATEDWDSTNVYTPAALHTLVLLSSPLPVDTLLTFPPTLTHLALLALPAPAQVHRLPRICPLIEVLDLSFNVWLVEDFGKNGESILDRIEWNRWSRLRVLGLRECGVGTDIVARVNQSRWTDVEIIGVDTSVG